MSYFNNYLKKYENKKVNIFIDMDGVVADYDAISFKENKDNDDVYLNKRPIMTVISILEEISTLPNIELYILSCTKKESQINGKLIWLSKYMSFIKVENINIISREKKNYNKAYDIKKVFLKENCNTNEVNIVIDDSHDVIKEIMNLDLGIIPIHITSILD